MRTAYGLLGIMIITVCAGAILLIDKKGHTLDDAALKKSMTLHLTSPAFEENGLIPARFSCDGENVNPPLSISGAPKGTASFALVVEDPDIPQGVKDRMKIDVFDHWVVFNISPETSVIPEGATLLGVQGKNSAGVGYTGPCPPDREHRYFFMLYALDTMLEKGSDATKSDILDALEGHVLEKATLIGRYERLLKTN